LRYEVGDLLGLVASAGGGHDHELVVEERAQLRGIARLDRLDVGVGEAARLFGAAVLALAGEGVHLEFQVTAGLPAQQADEVRLHGPAALACQH
jgi:hypothetical protein